MRKYLRVFLFYFIIIAPKLYSQAQIDKIVNISRSPINVFKEACARCHGAEGSTYGEGFADMDDDALKNIVRMMMQGPAQLKPDQIDVDAMTAYNKSLKDKKPFAIVLNSKSFLEGKDKFLSVSVSPDAKINLIDNKKIKIENDEDMWKLFYDAGKVNKLKLIVTRDNTSSPFYFPEELWIE